MQANIRLLRKVQYRASSVHTKLRIVTPPYIVRQGRHADVGLSVRRSLSEGGYVM